MTPPSFAFSSAERFVAPQHALQGHMDHFEEQAPPPQPFEPAGLPQGQWGVFQGTFQ